MLDAYPHNSNVNFRLKGNLFYMTEPINEWEDLNIRYVCTYVCMSITCSVGYVHDKVYVGVGYVIR